MKSYSWSTEKVSIRVRNTDGKTIYKKKFKNSNLYIFRSGQIQIGQKNFNKVIISKSPYDNTFVGIIREKEGVY